MSRIVLHIDRLVLRGIEPGDAKALSAALQAELQRQLAISGMADTLSDIGQPARIKVGEVRSAGADHQGLGQAIAQRLANELHPGHAS